MRKYPGEGISINPGDVCLENHCYNVVLSFRVALIGQHCLTKCEPAEAARSPPALSVSNSPMDHGTTESRRHHGSHRHIRLLRACPLNLRLVLLTHGTASIVRRNAFGHTVHATLGHRSRHIQPGSPAEVQVDRCGHGDRTPPVASPFSER